MISYFLGIPGSGKTYYSVSVIYQNFLKSKSDVKFSHNLKKDYSKCFTNINELHFDKLDRVYKFDYDVFLKKLTILHKMYKKDKVSDEVLIEKAKELDMYKILFVIDEAHNYFSNYNEVVMWWLTYHRHLFHDVYLITQSLALINVKYKPLAECYYKAKPLSLVLSSKNFVYTYYTDSRLSDKSKVSQIKMKKHKEVFSIYGSGDAVVSPNVIARFIKIALFMAFVLSVGMYYFYFTHSPVKEDNKSNKIEIVKKNNDVVKSSISSDIDDNDYILVEMICDISDNCKIFNYQYPYSLLFNSFEKYNTFIIFRKDEGVKKTYYLSATSSFRDFFSKSYLQDEVEQSDASISLFGKDK